MKEQRLCGLANLSIETSAASKIDYEELVEIYLLSCPVDETQEVNFQLKIPGD